MLTPGTRVGPYEIVQLAGAGGMGIGQSTPEGEGGWPSASHDALHLLPVRDGRGRAPHS